MAPPGGQAGNKHTLGISAVALVHCCDHLADRQRLPAAAAGILRRKPIEAEVRIVGALLLRKEKRETMLVRGAGPVGTLVIAARCLSAAVEDDDKRRTRTEAAGQILSCLEVARVRAETAEERQPVIAHIVPLRRGAAASRLGASWCFECYAYRISCRPLRPRLNPKRKRFVAVHNRFALRGNLRELGNLS